MKLFMKLGLASLLVASLVASPIASAATSPGIGAANSFVILSGTYSNVVSGTTLSGDLGYTTPPATTPTVNGVTHIADTVYNQAGIDQANALSYLNSQPCTYNFPSGAVDLATNTTHGPVGVYTPGVYCMTGAGNAVVSGDITLDGSGTYIFRIDGALTTGANSSVTLINGASACDVWWTPTQATTLGADSTFVGTDIDASGITIGNNVTWVGQALAFGGTVTTTADTMTAPTCTAGRAATPTAPTPPTAAGSVTPGAPDTGVHQAANSSSLFGFFAVTGAGLVGVYVVRRYQRTL